MNPWDRQKGETIKAFHAFTHYRELGAERSISQSWRAHKLVCEKVDGEKAANLRQYPRNWDRWSSRFRWVERAAAWDAKLEQDAQQKHRKRILDTRERHANIAAAGLAVAAALERAALDAIRDPEALKKLVEASKDNPKALRVLMDLASRQAGTIKALTDVERLALGLSTESVEIGERSKADPLADQLASDPDAVSQIVAALQGGK